VVGLSGHVTPDYVRRGTVSGMDDYLPKPLTRDALRHVL
jgi:YesN/AraC family two-component response regulator